MRRRGGVFSPGPDDESVCPSDCGRRALIQRRARRGRYNSTSDCLAAQHGTGTGRPGRSGPRSALVDWAQHPTSRCESLSCHSCRTTSSDSVALMRRFIVSESDHWEHSSHGQYNTYSRIRLMTFAYVRSTSRYVTVYCHHSVIVIECHLALTLFSCFNMFIT